jgi:hypothetical protein
LKSVLDFFQFWVLFTFPKLGFRVQNHELAATWLKFCFWQKLAVENLQGISPSNYFLGVCLGALITLPIQIGIGVLLRDRPVAALAGVAAAVGIWSILPYAAAAIASAIYVIRQNLIRQSFWG